MIEVGDTAAVAVLVDARLQSAQNAAARDECRCVAFWGGLAMGWGAGIALVTGIPAMMVSKSSTAGTVGARLCVCRAGRNER